MATHHLKTWPTYFQAALEDLKTFEIRQNDRDFNLGDALVLEEFEPEAQQYTGRSVEVLVTYITGFPRGLKDNYVCMSVLRVR